VNRLLQLALLAGAGCIGLIVGEALRRATGRR